MRLRIITRKIASAPSKGSSPRNDVVEKTVIARFLKVQSKDMGLTGTLREI
jgi:hypothetical protein